MAGVKISGGEHPLKDIFSDAYVFEVPSYQRPYSWGTEQVTELLDDLLDAMETSDEKEPDPYFLGAIVLAKDEAQPHAKVIDGQQRLTTLTLLLAALADRLPSEMAADLRVFIGQKQNMFSGAAETMRLTLRDRDAAFFREYVQQPGGLTKLLALDPGQHDNDAKRNIQANAELMLRRLDELTEEQRRTLGLFLVAQCFLVAVSTPDHDSAYRIFAILNDRGLDLSHADIIKSEVIGRIEAAQQDAYNKKWEDVEDELGTDDFKDLFSHIRMIYAKTKVRGTVLKEFREYVLNGVADPRAFIDDVVAPYGDVFARIRTQSWESATSAEFINRWLHWLGRIDNFDWVPPAILYMSIHKNDPAKLTSFLERLERLAGTLYIRRAGINERIERYAALLDEIQAVGNVHVTGSALDLTDSERTKTIERLDGDVYLDKPRSYILLRLDESLNAGGAAYDHKITTVEHVLPQNPAEGSQWLADFTDEDRQAWTHRVANLVLLPKRKNSAAQNYDFDLKKDKYFRGTDGSSPFLLTMQVLEREVWTPSLLAARQETLMKDLKSIWAL